ncbi:hypothetical protein CH333_05280 [candidate division WOR-3 bacterium JGI_Cruoil_03_44_89]|uniref:Uncharacterized protein n=1 Tax=candidate division WOR-3 bacterium JGI_Cruoil_03_44_89 TaxID=1973748 RepID=A0A235BUZ9_UNCW3|nr:MAG: hypothetical protein CH333_05280 [candidate division WOR-3 bacterium JGI_Cruoil_03_44_89]
MYWKKSLGIRDDYQAITLSSYQAIARSGNWVIVEVTSLPTGPYGPVAQHLIRAVGPNGMGRQGDLFR